MPQCTKTGEYKSVQCRGSQCYCVTKTGQKVEGTDVDQDKKPVCPGEMFYLTMHSTHFIYGYMASDIWLRTILIVRKETRCRHIGYSYRLVAKDLLYAPSHRQDNTYHGLWYTSRGALAGTRIWKEGNVLFNNALNTFYLRLYGRKEMFHLTMHSTHFIYGYMEGRKCFI